MSTLESPRTRRLRSDLQALRRLAEVSSIFQFEARSSDSGVPHEYVLWFHGAGLWRPAHSSEVLVRDVHQVSIRMGANYPRSMPDLAWRSPIFHPNISTSGVVCLGGYGTFWAPSLHVDELCVMLWDMIRYANYDTRSPYNREAAHWAQTQSRYQFPIDRRSLRDRLDAHQAGLRSPESTAPPRPPRLPPPEIEFLGDVVVEDIVEAEVVEAPAEIMIIE